MCLISYTKKMLRAETDLGIYKLLVRNKGNCLFNEEAYPYLTPFQCVGTDIPGSLKAYSGAERLISGWKFGRWEFYGGIVHAYRDDIFGLRQLLSQTYSYHNIDNMLVLAKGHIPKGTWFVAGEYGECAAKTIVLDSVAAANSKHIIDGIDGEVYTFVRGLSDTVDPKARTPWLKYIEQHVN